MHRYKPASFHKLHLEADWEEKNSTLSTSSCSSSCQPVASSYHLKADPPTAPDPPPSPPHVFAHEEFPLANAEQVRTSRKKFSMKRPPPPPPPLEEVFYEDELTFPPQPLTHIDLLPTRAAVVLDLPPGDPVCHSPGCVETQPALPPIDHLTSLERQLRDLGFQPAKTPAAQLPIAGSPSASPDMCSSTPATHKPIAVLAVVAPPSTSKQDPRQPVLAHSTTPSPASTHSTPPHLRTPQPATRHPPPTRSTPPHSALPQHASPLPGPPPPTPLRPASTSSGSAYRVARGRVTVEPQACRCRVGLVQSAAEPPTIGHGGTFTQAPLSPSVNLAPFTSCLGQASLTTVAPSSTAGCLLTNDLAGVQRMYITAAEPAVSAISTLAKMHAGKHLEASGATNGAAESLARRARPQRQLAAKKQIVDNENDQLRHEREQRGQCHANEREASLKAANTQRHVQAVTGAAIQENVFQSQQWQNSRALSARPSFDLECAADAGATSAAAADAAELGCTGAATNAGPATRTAAGTAAEAGEGGVGAAATGLVGASAVAAGWGAEALQVLSGTGDALSAAMQEGCAAMYDLVGFAQVTSAQHFITHRSPLTAQHSLLTVHQSHLLPISSDCHR